MNRDEIMQMDAAQLRIEIAKAKGYEEKHGFLDAWSINPKTYWVTPTGRLTSVLPDWPTSIADAWELEGELTLKNWKDYVYTLQFVVAKDVETIFTCDFDDESRIEIHPFELIHATPEQRSRAWLIWKAGE